LHLFKALEELVGSEVYRTALESLPAAVRSEMDAITAVSWAPITLIADVVEEIARCAGLEVEGLVDRAVRRAAERSLKTVWRVFLRVAPDDALIKRAGLLYSRSRNVGQLHARMAAPGHAELLLSDWPNIPERQLRAIGINIESALTLAGRHDVRVRAERSVDGCRYELRWRV
jgi:post-segregation antitoxin (ccd killing protein)